MLELHEDQAVIHLYHSLGALDAWCFARGMQCDEPTPAFAHMILLAIYPSPWEDLKRALASFVAPTGRGIDEAKIIGGKMGLRLVWQALHRATGLEDEWDRDDAAHWCRRLSSAIDTWLARAAESDATDAAPLAVNVRLDAAVLLPKQEPDVDQLELGPATPSTTTIEPPPRALSVSSHRAPSPSPPRPKRHQRAQAKAGRRGPFSGTPPAPPTPSSSQTFEQGHPHPSPPAQHIQLAESSRATYGSEASPPQPSPPRDSSPQAFSPQSHLPPSLSTALTLPSLAPPPALLPLLTLDFLRTAPRDNSHPPDFGTGNVRTVSAHLCVPAALNFGPSSPGAPFALLADPATLATWRDAVAAKGPGGIPTFLSTPVLDRPTKLAWRYQGQYVACAQVGTVSAAELRALSPRGKSAWGELLAAHCKVEKSKVRVGKDRAPATPAGRPSFMTAWGFGSASAGGAMLEIEAGAEVAIAYAVFRCVGFDDEALAGWVATRAKRIEAAEVME